MSSEEGWLLPKVEMFLEKLGNIGTLSLDDQIKRVNEVMGKAPTIEKYNIHKLAVQTNLSYGTIMLLLRLGLDMEGVVKDSIALFADINVLRSFSTNYKEAQQQKQIEPIIEDEPILEKMEITMDQSISQSSTPSQENAKTPKKKKSRKSKKQIKQPEDTSSAKSGKSNVNQGETKKSKGKKFTRGVAEKVITGNTTNEANLAHVRHITIYDIPVEWTHEQILQALSSWGNTIKFSTKKQRKFQTLWVKIILNDQTRAHFDGGLWMYTLNNIAIRWFPGDWSLKERKNRERFCLVWRNCPESQHTQRLVNQNLQSDFLAKYSIKAYKAIKTPKGERQLIAFFERHTDMLFALRTSFDIDNSTYNWSRGDLPRQNPPRRDHQEQRNRGTSSTKKSYSQRSKDQNPNKTSKKNKFKGSTDVFNTLVDL